jgi:branched-chain amino acid transport system substrate-binding protein
MLATTASAQNVTRGRPYVFRVSFPDSEQGPVLAKAVSTEFNVSNVAIIVADGDPYSMGLASGIRGYWEYLHPNSSSPAIFSFNGANTSSSVYKDLATAIASANVTPQLLFVPVLSRYIANVVKAVVDAGWNGQLIGADTWANAAAIKECGKACNGAYFTSNFIASGALGYARDFVDRYIIADGVMPDDHAALAYDAMNLIKAGLEKHGNWTCDLAQDRDGLRIGMQNLIDFKGVGGDIAAFDENNDPINKCLSFGRVNESTYTQVYRYCPDL